MSEHDDLNRKLAEWAGFEELGVRDKFKRLKGFRYPHPDGCIYSALPDFLHSTDDCFKWLVPKLDAYTLQNSYGGLHKALVFPKDNPSSYGFAEEAETPALALCKAIEKVINE